ncbi:unnamed protein product [Parnassius mnemosyne]|uniref:Reverse transcriptase n=1 Tax=Parnassius mnemosyne TaxID=213953 RepID=A0AAV1LLJ1_9NEOP
MLSTRIIKIAGESQPIQIKKGCPQGGVISPLLWNMVINELISKLNDNHFYTVGYADDLTILVSGKTASIVCDLTQAALRIVERWCREHDLTVNPNKTVLVMFTQKRKLNNYHLPSLFSTKLQLSSEVKYLGLTLDSKLNWNKHIENKINKASITFWQCRNMIGKRWGLTPKIILWLYKTVIRPMITYGALVWWTKTNEATIIKKLQRYQRLACMAATGCMRTTPTAALEAMLELTPLHLHIQQEATLAAIRLKTLNLWSKNSVPHTGIIDRIHSKIPILQAKYDRIPKQFVFDKKYKIQLNENSQPEGLSPKELTIFTDGSKTNEGVGSGAFSEDLNIHICTPLGTYNTVFQAECMGIIQAAIAIDARKVNDFPIRILTDSRAVLQALRCNVVNSGLIYECHQRLNEVCKNNNVTLQWIKGHSLKGNEEADRLAKAAITHGIELNILPIYTEILTKFKNLCYDKFREYFDERNRENGIWYKTIQSQPLRIPWYNNIKMNRNHIIVIHRLRSGHYPNKKFVFLMKKADSPNCDICHIIEDVQHMLAECVKYQRERENLVQKFSINLCETGWFLNILAEPHSAVAKSVSTIFLPH